MFYSRERDREERERERQTCYMLVKWASLYCIKMIIQIFYLANR